MMEKRKLCIHCRHVIKPESGSLMSAGEYRCGHPKFQPPSIECIVTGFVHRDSSPKCAVMRTGRECGGSGHYWESKDG